MEYPEHTGLLQAHMQAAKGNKNRQIYIQTIVLAELSQFAALVRPYQLVLNFVFATTSTQFSPVSVGIHNHESSESMFPPSRLSAGLTNQC